MGRTSNKVTKRASVPARLFTLAALAAALLTANTAMAYADTPVGIAINGQGSDVVKLIMILTVLAIAPFLLLMMTCFARIIIVLSFMRSALGLQQTPPNQVLIGLALFITFFVMAPVLTEINETALQPYNEGLITTEQFLDTATVPLKDFMLKQTGTQEMDMYKSLSTVKNVEKLDAKKLPLSVVVPAFITSELKRAFLIGFLLYIPFLLIDMIVASVLMSMGMIMLPPVMISLPFKLMLFVVVDGWDLLVKTLIMTYN
jgi:flagellar biosynthesis protein FliP